MRWAVALILVVLAAPAVSAAVPFTREYTDPVGDNEAPSADVVRVTSSVEAGVVTQRVEMAAAPDLALDTVILRSWFHDSTNGSFHVVDLEVHAGAPPEEKFRSLVRRGGFEDVTPIDATWSVEGNAHVFTFSESHVADAACFDPIVWAQHEPPDGTWSADVGGVGTRYCRVRGDPTDEPAPRATPEPPAAGAQAVGGQPGTSQPPISPWLVLGVALAAVVLTHRIWRRR